MVKRSDSRQDESDLERIQDLFPSDNLRLNDADPLSPVSLTFYLLLNLIF